MFLFNPSFLPSKSLLGFAQRNYHIWIRNETKHGEKRVALIPQHAKTLIQAGHKVTVERSPNRIFADPEWERIPGIEMAPTDSWITSAPHDAYILGLKELPEGFPLVHNHIYFAHVYKGQKGARSLFQRFQAGGGKILDLEFLVDAKGRRVCAFGWSAGYVGAAVAVKLWGLRKASEGTRLGKLNFWPTDEQMLSELRTLIEPQLLKTGKPPILIIGALGRVGAGCTALLQRLGLNYTDWDRDQTGAGGPFKEIVTDFEIFLNAIYLSGPTSPFIDFSTIEKYNDERKLTIIGDISCDWASPYNPIPLYSRNTTFDDPTIEVFPELRKKSNPSEIIPRIDLIGIDYLPALLPRESASEFSAALLPSLLELDKFEKSSPVWQRAYNLFEEKKVHVLEFEHKDRVTV